VRGKILRAAQDAASPSRPNDEASRANPCWSQNPKNIKPAKKKRRKQHDDNDCTQDVPLAAAPLPRFNRRVPMLSVEHLAGPNILN
jgi:hypothetical protein